MFDVFIVGGGVSGLLLERHLRLIIPGIRTAIGDPGQLPVDPRRSKVGESATEVASWYLEHRLGLGEHLAQDHVKKLGVRFFLPTPGRSFGERTEFGVMTPRPDLFGVPFDGVKPPTWQLHRGRLEHRLYEDAARAGVPIFTGSRPVVTVGEPHTITMGDRRWTARWVIDASGAGGGLPMPEGDDELLPHKAQAAWFWVPSEIDVDRFSDAPGFRARIPADLRWHSTTHLVGLGYWVWLIRLGDGTTSVGLVSDPRHHPPERFRDLPAGLAWLAEHEPECAVAVAEAGPAERWAFRAWQSHARHTLASSRRWAVTGDTAAFLDPLFSSGLDLIVTGNELLVPLIRDDLLGIDLGRRCPRVSALFLQIAGQYLGLYTDVFRTMGHPRAMTAKIVWDLGTYFGFLAPVVRSGSIADEAFMARVAHVGRGVAELQRRVAACVSAWTDVGADRPAGDTDQSRIVLLGAMLTHLRARLDGEATLVALGENLLLLEQLAVTIWRASCRERGLGTPDGPVNPYAIGPDPERWARDGLLSGAHPVSVPAWVADDLRQAGL